MITFEILTSSERLVAIAPAWQQAWQQHAASAFQSHAWITAWDRHRGADYDLLIGLAWKAERLLAVLPCAVRAYRGLRILEWAAQGLSDYCDGFGDIELFPSLWEKLLLTSRPDIVRLKNISSQAVARPMLEQSGLMRSDGDLCLQIRSQWATGEAWFSTLNKKKRNNHTRGRRKLEAMGTIEISIHYSASMNVMGKLFALKETWLKHNDLSSPLVENGFGLLWSLVNSLEKTKKLCIVLITCNREVVAGSINVIEGRNMLAFFAAYDPAYEAASPGIMLMTEYTRWAFSNGFTVIDYLRGAESYKYEFSNAHVILDAFIGAYSVKGKIALSAFQLGQNVIKTCRSKPQTGPTIGGAYTTSAGTSRLETAQSKGES